MDGKCQESGIIYQATVTQKDNGKTVTYVGLTETTFKLKYGNHKLTFKNKNQQIKTELSKYIWENNQKQYDIKWKILKNAKPYSNTTKRCNLCMEEKYIITYKPEMASLNQRGGVVTSCLHSRKFLLANHPG